MALTDIYVQYGDAETFWDASFDDAQRAYAGAVTDEITGISVLIDPDDGTIALNAGYDERSKPYRDEKALFDTYKDAIVEALTHAVRSGAEYEAFKIRAGADATRRARALAMQEERMLENEDDGDIEDAA